MNAHCQLIVATIYYNQAKTTVEDYKNTGRDVII